MKNNLISQLWNFSSKGLSIIAMVLLVSLCTSCSTRQARVIGKVANEIRHVNESESSETGTINDESNDDGTQEETLFSITGVVQYDDGHISELDPDDAPTLRKTTNELFMYWGGLHKYNVHNNDIVTITETYDLPDNSEYEYSFGETATRPYDVSDYSFLCEMDDRVYYFNVNRKL